MVFDTKIGRRSLPRKVVALLIGSDTAHEGETETG
jgi:hypothetical protein